MKVFAILNNYQLGSYPAQCLSQKIISKERIDTYHTKVIWELDSSSDRLILEKALGNPKRVKDIEE